MLLPNGACIYILASAFTSSLFGIFWVYVAQTNGVGTSSIVMHKFVVTWLKIERSFQLYILSAQASLFFIGVLPFLGDFRAASIPRSNAGVHFQMKLVTNQLAPLFLFLLQWMDSSCLCLLPRYLDLFHIVVYKVYADGRSTISKYGRKATIRDFYGVILPSLQRLHGNLVELDYCRGIDHGAESSGTKEVDSGSICVDVDLDREDECGICLEPCTKMVLPNCCHAMCIKCYRNWNFKSESCPFCRGSLKRVNSEDLWVLTCNDDVVDMKTVCKDDLLRFYLYVGGLPKAYPDALFLVYYEYLI